MRKIIIIFFLLLFITSSHCFAQAKYYYLAPWEWYQESPTLSYWRCPGGDCVGLVDLRSIPQMSKAGGLPEGYGFFAYKKEKDIKGSIYLGDDLNAVARGKVETILDFLWNELTVRADPAGKDAARPLVPNNSLNLELHLGGHSLVRSEKFDKTKHPFVLEAIRNDYRRIRQEDKARGSDNYKKVLDAWEEKYKIDYREFIPRDLPDEGKLPHKTTITEDWDCSDSDSLNCDLTWTEVAGDIDIVSSKASATNQSSVIARAESSLSSDDHYSQAEVTQSIDFRYTGVAVRMHSSDNTEYYFRARRNQFGYWEIYKVVTGTSTLLDQENTNPWDGSASTFKLTANGSSLEGLQDGTSRITVTDTSITGNVRAGIYGSPYSVADDFSTWDNFEAGDLAGYFRFKGLKLRGLKIK